MSVLTSTQGQTGLPRYFAQTFNIVKDHMARGSVEFGLPDGRVFLVQGAEAGHRGRIDIHDEDLFARLIREGDLGFSEAYLDGAWTTPDLQAVLDVFLANNEEVLYAFPGAGLVRIYERFRHWMNSNSKTQARKNISYHYDLGNDFYGLWLDETMTYSSAIFETGQEDLATAQTRKYQSMCDEMGMSEGDHLLEIGCGWGGFAEYAASQRGARVTGLTISQAQHDYAKERIFKAGLADKVDIVMRDYRDETGTYDGIASIEMFEAVGEKYWPAYFKTVHDRLKAGKQATLQIITIADKNFEYYRKNTDFIQKYIFPGGMLPSPSALKEQIIKAGLEPVKSIEFGESYSQTLRRWHEDFNAQWDKIEPMGFDQRFRNMWNFYLTSCAASFHVGAIDVTQTTLRKPS